MKKVLILATALVFAGMSNASFAGGDGISLTLNGKEVKSIPIDKLGTIKFTVKAGSSFKGFYKDQWGGIENTLKALQCNFNKNEEEPNFLKNYELNPLILEDSFENKNWGAKKVIERPMSELVNPLHLYELKTGKKVTFGVRFGRRDYTGKTVWKNGGWVQEALWSDVGPVLGKATLSLEQPTFSKAIESSVDNALKIATDTLNAGSYDLYSTLNPAGVAHILLTTGTGVGGYDYYQGSKLVSLKKSGDILYNYGQGSTASKPYVHVEIPVDGEYHMAMKNAIGMGIEEDFKCKDLAYVVFNSYNGTIDENSASFKLRQDNATCTNKEGKTTKQLGQDLQNSLLGGSSNNNSNGSTPNPMDLIKGILKEIK